MKYSCLIVAALLVFVSVSLSAQDRIIIQGVPPGAPPPEITGPQGPMPPRDTRAPAATGTSRIRGRVVAGDTGLPLRRATVRLLAPSLRVNRSTTTAEDGTYEFRELASGSYTLSAARNGYVNLNFGQTRPNESGRPIELRDKQVMERVDFTLPRGAVITGRVIDEVGDPVANVSVQAVQYRFMNGQRQLTQVAPIGRTLDTGEFRLFGLMPGDYSVMATLSAGSMFDQSDDRIAYGVTYFPGTLEPTEARMFRLGVGQMVSSVDILLSPVRTATVSGLAIDSQGRPARGNLAVSQRRKGVSVGGMTAVMGGASNIVGPDGRFTLRSLVPGEYTINVTGTAPAPGVTPETLTATVTVDGIDLTDVVLTPLRPAKLSGRVTFDAGAQPPLSTDIRVTAQARVFAPSAMPPTLMGITQPIVNEEYRFEITASPGETNVRASVTDSTWVLKAVRRSGVDVTDTGLTLSPGEAVDDLEVELTNRPQDVSGGVTDARGQSINDYSVVFFARDPDRRQEPTRYFGLSRPDQEGRYRSRSLPPGEYYAVAVEYFDPTQRGDLDLLREFERSATAFTLREGETRVLNLTLAAQ